MDPNWARGLRDWSAAHSIPFFMKQMGAWDMWASDEDRNYYEYKGGKGNGNAIPADLRIQQSPFKSDD
jgi:hypothetical protein